MERSNNVEVDKKRTSRPRRHQTYNSMIKFNLAAIGKTTGDDPFTPSWRLIGGYWQWGRKGPDESEWYES